MLDLCPRSFNESGAKVSIFICKKQAPAGLLFFFNRGKQRFAGRRVFRFSLWAVGRPYTGNKTKARQSNKTRACRFRHTLTRAVPSDRASPKAANKSRPLRPCVAEGGEQEPSPSGRASPKAANSTHSALHIMYTVGYPRTVPGGLSAATC